jgi:hypothetical protein
MVGRNPGTAAFLSLRSQQAAQPHAGGHAASKGQDATGSAERPLVVGAVSRLGLAPALLTLLSDLVLLVPGPWRSARPEGRALP